ncbi:hypothetical protein GWN42_31190 [candidate division KSB1 bacterium]|nr:hypothetical protein [Phycisphaerae bacterium]NIQ92524.1 hypothetical protein [Deltaproteobacteria bacterium]NIV97134.1 hypothetical protein [candidate division KSB1 bacterium]
MRKHYTSRNGLSRAELVKLRSQWPSNSAEYKRIGAAIYKLDHPDRVKERSKKYREKNRQYWVDWYRNSAEFKNCSERTRQRYAEFSALREAGLPVKKIAEQYGVHPQTVRNGIKTLIAD